MAEFFSHWDPRRNLVIKLILFLSGPETPFPLGVFINAGLHHTIGQWWIWGPDGRMADAGPVTQAPNTCLCALCFSLNAMLKLKFECKQLTKFSFCFSDQNVLQTIRTCFHWNHHNLIRVKDKNTITNDLCKVQVRKFLVIFLKKYSKWKFSWNLKKWHATL